MVRVSFVVGAAFALAVAACSDSTPPQVNAITVDSVFAELSDAQDVAGRALTVNGGSFLTNELSADACTYSAESTMFECPVRAAHGLSIEQSYQLLDASGSPLAAFDAATVAGVRVVVDVSGTVQADTLPLMLTITRHGDHTLSGLLTDRHVLDGTAHTTISIGDAAALRTVIDETVNELVLPEPDSATPWPQSGSVSLDVVTGGGFEGTVNVLMTFDGTSTATITLSRDDVPVIGCTLDLSDPSSRPACSPID
jgi:hypothetical protein